ncbi:DUF29 domain-containing protein [Aphanothece hegewaldii CCALA 016]|uniref:DUF29 domain-containing protein n=1 Tax=Aphanothece hegewaldii CCALA 016 TaxID=2107694 RepID=A0A2T1LV39_9CHRO|nr:DUF29 domain-containing protein [Aphanothece hegewaldii]PSF35539.1 DUF29 domain-containing protein [Aphanothece hegewaldii CCALA 016]
MKIETKTLYEQDFYRWIETTVNLLQEGRWTEIERENLIEELISMGKSERNALKSNLRVLLMHLLKYQYEPERRSNSWLYTIFEHRKRIQDSLQDSPSLKRYLEEVFEECYKNARKEASLETGLTKDKFPLNSPFSIDEVLDEDFLPV